VHETIVTTINELRACHNYVFTTGGIGPTHDDITADAVAAAFGRSIDIREDALAFYRRFYTPENAILVVAGDVVADEVHRLADDTYGRIPARGEAPVRVRPQEPDSRASRLGARTSPRGLSP
jgi:hypothetical protein